MKKQNIKYGFTLIELIITIVLMGIILVPLGLMAMDFMRAIPYSRDLGVAEGLAKTEMAKINNLAYTDATLADGYDNTTANYEGYPYDLRRSVSAGPVANLKQVQVRIYPAGNTSQPLINLLSYIANVTFGSGSGGGGPLSGGDADFLLVSGGNISGSQLQNITLENAGATPVTITGVIITFTGSNPAIKLSTITLGGSQRWSGNASSGSTITLTTSFTLTAGTTYTNNSSFAFSKTLASVTSLVFIMSDASETSSYSW